MKRGAVELDLTPPSGLIRYKYSDFVHNDDFPEIGIVGPMATAKSSAAVDRLGRRGLEYPGINLLLARGTLTSLKDSTIPRLRQRLGALFDPSRGGGENLQEAIFRFPPSTHPVTGLPVQSVIKGIGLDRADLENVLKSTEYGGGHLEEANEIPSDAHDLLQERCRQEIWHRERTVKDMCMRLAVIWSEVSGKALTWRDVHAILLDDPMNRVGERQLPADHPEPGDTVVGASWNPVGNDHTWLRYVGVPYPFPAPTEKWVADNVGVREVHVPPAILREDKHRLRAGALVSYGEGKRDYVKKHDLEGGTVELVSGASLPHDKVGLIVQRYCIYAFGHENMSRDHKNVENTYLMANQEMRRKHQLGHVDVREGRVTPAFIDEPVAYGGHLLPEVSRERIMRAGNLIVGGLDHGGDHPTALALAMYLPAQRTLVVFDEYVQSGLSAYANATAVQQMLVPGLEHMIGYDPAMNARTFDREADRRIIDNYIEVMGDIFLPGTAGPVAFDELAAMTEIVDDFTSDRGPMPRLLVTENCVQVRKTLLSLEWRMVRHQRGNWMVDMGDALKLMTSLVKRGAADAGNLHVDMAPVRAYSDRWKDGKPLGGRQHVGSTLE